jgi:hypothetical protein
MATTLTASRPSRRGVAASAVLLALIFFATQTTALTHEIEHVLHQHDVRCVLHLAADHLTMLSAPDPEPAVTSAPATSAVLPLLLAPPARPAHPSAARAPPLLP